MRILTLFMVLLLSALLYAAENPPPQGAADDEELRPAEIETPAGTPAENELILADVDDAAPGDEDLANRRFIPTEEISQDLGVSFPVDI